jgi:hypothetical protein
VFYGTHCEIEFERFVNMLNKNVRLKFVGAYLLNIQMDHIPINRHMSGSFDGNMRLNDRAPPNNIEA